jgi:glycosyltransferase involved in cell wall biosynthesis
MNSTPKISVIMPVYNGEEFLKEAIESILNQTYRDFEFIIAYDESSDTSLEIIKYYQNIDSRIVLSTGCGRGLVNALNDAIDIARGKYIARMDADDVSFLDRIKSQYEFLDNHALDICGGHFLLIDDKGKVNGLNVIPISHEMCTLSLLFKVPFAHPSVMIRKSFLDNNSLKYGQSKYQIAEDLDLWVRMHKCGAKFGNVNNVILKYRILDNSLSRVNNSLVLQDSKSIFKQFHKDNCNIASRIVKDSSLQTLNAEEKSLLVRYIYNDMKRLNFSNFKLIKQIDRKIILNSVLSEMLR